MRFNINVKEWQDNNGNIRLLYSAPITSKKLDGKEITKFLRVRFAKCEAPKTNCRIEEIYSFMSVFEKNDGTVEYELVILNYNVLENPTQQNTAPVADKHDDIPF